MSATAAAHPSPLAARRIGFAAILTGITASVLMQTMLATAMPQVVIELGDEHLYGWVFASYLLASTLPLPVFAQLADLHGRRPLFLLGMSMYAAGTALAALSGSMEMLVAARVVQGLGAGALVPAALAGVADLSTGAAKGRLFGVIGVIQVLGNVVGPIVGGVFTDGPGWRWALWAVAPVALVAVAFAAIGLPKPAGAPLATAWARVDWAQPVRVVRSDAPARRIWAGAFLLGVALMSATAYLPLLAQRVFGASASGTTAVLIPLMVGVGVGSMVGGRLSATPGRLGLAAAWAVAAVAFGVLALTAGGPGGLWLAAVAAAAAGVGIGTVQPILLVDAQASASPDSTAAYSAMVQLARNLGGAVGTSGLGILVAGGSVATGLVGVFVALAAASLLGAATCGRPKTQAARR